MNSTEKKGALIGKTGAVVIEAPSAAAGFAALRQHHPHVLIADLNMPGESGFEFIAKIRALPAEEGGGTPAVALSALGPEAVRPALEAGFQAFLAKPADPAEILQTVTRFL
jgi:CheY-like chemotaxis protein